ncbi:Choline transport protein [Fusarium oxysporum f. sp. albedinis]|nr:Choline transport protein [Fusarium oxysporum f. sp. albedinis]
MCSGFFFFFQGDNRKRIVWRSTVELMLNDINLKRVSAPPKVLTYLSHQNSLSYQVLKKNHGDFQGS